MRLHAWACLAFSSTLLIPLQGATRPRYGGTLTLELSSPLMSPELRDSALSSEVLETLLRFNAQGDVEPQLAVAWQPEPDRKRWRFTLRSKVVFHDGDALNAATVAPVLQAALKKKYGEVAITAGGQALVIQCDRPMSDLLSELASPRTAIFRKNDVIIGTGPFRVASWEAGRRLTLAAFNDYWGGRPYLDSVAIEAAPSRGRADVFEVSFGAPRRILPEGARLWSSPPHELMALEALDVQPVVWQALALCIDRASIVNVLMQRRGEAAFGLLPQWLSGYAFLFQMNPDVGRAKQLIAQLRLSPLTLSYPPNDSFARSVADRVAVNARDAGINIQPSPNSNGNLRLARWPLEAAAGMLGRSGRVSANDLKEPEALYQAERAFLDKNHILPLVFLPTVYGIMPRVHNWDAAHRADPLALHLENAWVEQ
jgi:ABC-type transport system substrate-binding protein